MTLWDQLCGTISLPSRIDLIKVMRAVAAAVDFSILNGQIKLFVLAKIENLASILIFDRSNNF